jgi:hypothetical protein
MPGPIVYHDRSVIRSPDVAGLRQALSDLTEFVREREPQLLFYGFSIDEASSAMHVLAVHPDSDSLELHLGIGGPEFRKAGAFIELQRIEVFGEITDAVREALREKAAMLGKNAGVSVLGLASGFERISALGQL